MTCYSVYNLHDSTILRLKVLQNGETFLLLHSPKLDSSSIDLLVYVCNRCSDRILTFQNPFFFQEPYILLDPASLYIAVDCPLLIKSSVKLLYYTNSSFSIRFHLSALPVQILNLYICVILSSNLTILHVFNPCLSLTMTFCE